MSSDPAITAAERAWVKHFTAQGMSSARSIEAFGESYGTYDLQPWLMAEAAREALLPIREACDRMRAEVDKELGDTWNHDRWTMGMQEVLDEISSLISLGQTP